jgi:CHAT domain-containing protein
VLPGCGVGGPGLVAYPRGALPTADASDSTEAVTPNFEPPRVSEASMEKAVAAGLARSDAETSRIVERCLVPTRSQMDVMMESLGQMQRQPGAAAPPMTLRLAAMDPRLSRARLLRQQGLLDAGYALLVDVLCDYQDASSKSTVLREMVDNREEAGDAETAVWFVESWVRADESSARSQEEFARQQTARLQGAQSRLGGLMGGVGGPDVMRTMQESSREMRLNLLLPVVSAYARLGDLDRARQRLAEAQTILATMPAAAGRDPEQRSSLYYLLAEAAARAGDMPASRQAYAEAERLRRDRTRPPMTAVALPLFLAQLGEYADARRIAEATLAEALGWSAAPRARAGAREDPMSADLERVGTELSIAAAVEMAHMALAQADVAAGNGAAALSHLAEYDRARVRRRASQRALGAAMQRYAGNLGGFGAVMDSMGAFIRAQSYKERAERSWRYGQAYALANQPREAATELLQAVALVESLRGLIRPEDRVAFFGRYTSPYAALVDALLALPSTEGLASLPAADRGATPAETAFRYAEAARARLLSEQIAAAFVGAAERELPADVRERERSLQSAATAELRRGVAYDESPAYADFQRFVEELRRTHPAYATLKYPLPVAARQVPLRDGEAMIAYAVLERRVAIWLLRKGEPLRVFTSAVPRAELLATIEAFRRSVGVTASGLPSFDAAAAEKLHRWLLAEPLAPLPAGASVVIVPDGALATLPFEALGPPGPGGATAFASARYTFAYTPSATVLTFERSVRRERGAAAPRPLLALGDPVYEDLERLPAPSERRAIATRSLREQMTKRGPSVFAPLPATRVEVNRIAATLGVPPGPPDIRLGRAADEHDLKGLDLGVYRFVHFATHGVLAGDLPYLNQPALVLSQVADLRGEDGFLTMSEVLKLPLRADMVVLSACQTALGREVSGEGVVGLTRAFLYAGSRAAVVSLWPVDDASTALLMAKFYEHVTRGLAPAVALARAKQDLRGDGAHAHPFFWAPFVFFSAD